MAQGLKRRKTATGSRLNQNKDLVFKKQHTSFAQEVGGSPLKVKKEVVEGEKVAKPSSAADIHKLFQGLPGGTKSLIQSVLTQ